MADDQEILRRKSEHLDVILGGRGAFERLETGFDAIRLPHCAAPELNLSEIDLAGDFLGKRLAAPILVSSMTGGPARAAEINRALAEAVEAHGLAMGVGSQRAALEGAGAGGIDRTLRRIAPTAALYANLGAVQLVAGLGPDAAARAVEMIEADALFLHFNPLQEAVQPGGDRDWRGVLAAVERVCAQSSVPVIAKEVGFGISAPAARRLVEAGVAAIDVAGAGGSHWAKVEAARAQDSAEAAIAAAFVDWGLPTTDAVREVRAALPEIPLIASGGLRHGVDAAKAIALGANLAGFAAGVLRSAVDGPEAATRALGTLVEQLRTAAFCVGAPDLRALQATPTG
ncbi:MAG: type 2 isopentenyl-diphosphate Delta-isomerase [Pseudomonadota bacterium]